VLQATQWNFNGVIEQEETVVIEGVIYHLKSTEVPQVYSVLVICFEMFITAVHCYLGFICQLDVFTCTQTSYSCGYFVNQAWVN